MNRLQYGNWVPAGVVRVFSKRRGVWHYGILDDLQRNPLPSVYHASKDRGMFVLTTDDEFTEGEQATYTWRPADWETQRRILERAESQLGKRFSLLNSNCEDYVNWIVTGVARSPQRETMIALALIALFVGGLGLLSSRS